MGGRGVYLAQSPGGILGLYVVKVICYARENSYAM